MELLPTWWRPNPGVQPAAVAAPANGANSLPPNNLRPLKVAAAKFNFSNTEVNPCNTAAGMRTDESLAHSSTKPRGHTDKKFKHMRPSITTRNTCYSA
jgi:hypothetical protein